jgi:peptidyl-prolyl cis-trans isomerase A (cyclophilin A)
MDIRFARRTAVRAVLVALAPLLLSAAPHRRASPPLPLGDTVRVALTTDLGVIEVELDHAHAPVTVENFVRYVDTRRFDGMTFYRAMHLAWGEQPNGLIQAGLQGMPGKVFAPITHEPTSRTGILHVAGTLSMARFAPGSATSDFSILLSDMHGFDADPAATDPDTQAGYAAFGHVVVGMDVVRRIWDAPRSPTKGEGVMKGQMLAPPVRVLTAKRVATPPTPSPAIANGATGGSL